mgnify:CR=1 FL=1
MTAAEWDPAGLRRRPDPGPIADDLECIGCGYNLRTLPGSGRCPECGRPVAWSLEVSPRLRPAAAGVGLFVTEFALGAACWVLFPTIVLPVMLYPVVRMVMIAAGSRLWQAMEDAPTPGWSVRRDWLIGTTAVGGVLDLLTGFGLFFVAVPAVRDGAPLLLGMMTVVAWFRTVAFLESARVLAVWIERPGVAGWLAAARNLLVGGSAGLLLAYAGNRSGQGELAATAFWIAGAVALLGWLMMFAAAGALWAALRSRAAGRHPAADWGAE